ncbi:hypothetical protein ACFV1L_10480 [Kitasatospora sp. NPDC059646]|uniref:hypothetical protein n=1 Tax=Kitasatospora sp. NPDC059646 TaxID=3346893 RepID=UPI00369DA3C5
MARTATITFTAALEVVEDGAEWEGEDMSPEDARGWVSHALARGDKHAWQFTAYGACVTAIEYGQREEEE